MSDPATLGLVISVVASVASQLLGPKQPGISSTGPRVGDTGVSSSAYGETIPVNYGTVRTGGNVIWSPGLREVRRTVDSEQGKGGGATVTSTTFAYYLDAAVAIGDGPLAAVTRVWANSKLIYDARPSTKAFFKYPTAKFRVYTGTEDQLPDPLMEAREGVGNVPAYRGLAYVVVEDLPLRDFGNGMPQLTFEATWNGADEFPKALLWGNADSFTFQNNGDFQGANPRWERTNPLVVDPENGVLWGATGTYTGEGRYTWSRIDLGLGRIVSQRDFKSGSGDDLAEDVYPPTADGDAVVVGPWLLFPGYATGGGTARIWRVDKRTFGVVAKSTAMSSARGGVVAMLDFDSLSPLELEPEVACIAMTQTELYMFPSELAEGAVFAFRATSDVDDLPTSSFFSAMAGPDLGGRVWVAWRQGTSAIGLVRVQVFSGGVTEGRGRYGAGVGVRYFNEPVVDAVYSLYQDIYGVGTGGTPTPVGLHLDQDNQQLVMFVASASLGGRLVKWDIASEAVSEVVSLEDLESPSFDFTVTSSLRRMTRWMRGQQASRYLYWRSGQGGSNFHQFEWNASDGVDGTGFKLTLRDVGSEFSLPSTGGVDQNYLPLVRHNALAWKVGPNVYRLDLDRHTEGPGDLEDVVLDQCSRAGIDASIVDASALSGIEVDGIELSRRGAGRDVMDRLSIAYLFDMVESDNGLKAVLRGGASAEVVDGDDLGASLERLQDQPRRLEERTLQEAEVPYQVDLKYTDKDRDYQAGSAIAKRQKAPVASVASGEPQRLELPVVLTAQEAARLADKQLGTTWASREKQRGTLPPRFLALDPADVVTVVRDGEEDLLVRVDELSFGAGMLVEMQSSAEDPDVYASSVEGSSGEGLADNELSVPGPVQVRVLDLPLLKDSHARADLTGPYVGVELETGDFRGAVVHQSLDQVSWVQVAALPEHVLGFVVLTGVDPLPEELAYQTDHDTELVVVPMNDASADALESITDAQLLTERNAAAWGSASGGWEVVKFRDVTDNGDGTWTLGGAWVRARRGTARVALLGHSAGDVLLLLAPNQSPDSWYRNTYEVGTLGQSRFLRATPLSHPFEAVDFTSFSVTGTDLKPYEVVHVESQRDVPSTNDVRLSWVRQTRVGGQAEWGDGVADTPVSEASEEYEVVLLGGPAHASPGSEVLSKSFTDQVDTSGDDFTAAEQAAAGYALADDLSFVIYQLSAAVGRGFPRTVTVPGV